MFTKMNMDVVPGFRFTNMLINHIIFLWFYVVVYSSMVRNFSREPGLKIIDALIEVNGKRDFIGSVKDIRALLGNRADEYDFKSFRGFIQKYTKSQIRGYPIRIIVVKKSHSGDAGVYRFEWMGEK